MLTAVTGPFDMNGQGVRDVRAPERLPEAMRYAQCQTAVPVPSKLDRSLVSESGRLPSQYLKRAGKGGVWLQWQRHSLARTKRPRAAFGVWRRRGGRASAAREPVRLHDERDMLRQGVLLC